MKNTARGMCINVLRLYIDKKYMAVHGHNIENDKGNVLTEKSTDLL